jgi:signal transduction histidine kinase
MMPFHSARIRLTAWYALIILFISGFFSLAFYQASTAEIQRVINRIEMEQERQLAILLPGRRVFTTHVARSTEELQQAKQRIATSLIIINGMILGVSGAASYFLAGRTLRPIQRMMDDQSQFISDASHELRTPIAILRAEMEGKLLEKKITDKQSRKLINSSLEELTVLQLLSNKLLKITQLQNMSTHTVFTNVAMRPLLQQIIEKMAPLAVKKDIQISTKVASGQVLANAENLQELFIILLDNAIKYSPPKSTISVTSKVVRSQYLVAIQDQGPGIPQRDQAHIFNRFYRVDSSRSKTEGYGLGLSIAKKIVDIYNGQITVKSRLKEGSTFTVLLPLK